MNFEELSHNYMYKKTRMELLDLVFENKEIFSDKENLVYDKMYHLLLGDLKYVNNVNSRITDRDLIVN